MRGVEDKHYKQALKLFNKISIISWTTSESNHFEIAHTNSRFSDRAILVPEDLDQQIIFLNK